MNKLIERYKAAIEINKSLNAIVDFVVDKEFEKSLSKSSKYIYDLKINMFTIGYASNAGTENLKGYRAPYNCSVYERMRNNSNFVFIGKTNCEEFASGSKGLQSTIYPVTKINNRLVGGSSSGAAASAFLISDLSFGTDTGGSCRLPAMCLSAGMLEMFGYKPSFGLISRFGVIQYMDSADTVGMLSKHPRIILEALKSIDAPDPKDNCCVGKEIIVRTKIKKVIVLYKDKYTPSEKRLIELISKNYEFEYKDYKFNLPLVKAAYATLSSIELHSSCSKFAQFKYGDIKNYEEASEEMKNQHKLYGGHLITAFVTAGAILGTAECSEMLEKATEARSEIYYAMKNIKRDEVYVLPSFYPNFSDLDTSLCVANLSGIPGITISCNNEELETTEAGFESGKINFGGISIMGAYGSDYDLLEFVADLQEKKNKTK